MKYLNKLQVIDLEPPITWEIACVFGYILVRLQNIQPKIMKKENKITNFKQQTFIR